MNKFVDEYVNSSFKKGSGNKNLHVGKEAKKTCYDRNNARNRDILTKAKAQGLAITFSNLTNGDQEIDPMDSIIDQIDKKSILDSWDSDDE